MLHALIALAVPASAGRRLAVGLRGLAVGAAALALLGSPVAFADPIEPTTDGVADEVDDILDEVLGDDSTPPPDTRSQREAVEREADRPSTEATPPSTAASRRRLIKTLQRKTFLKLGRWEATPHLGFVTNDPFLRRWVLGADIAYHVTEVLGVELAFGFSPDFGKADWKPITHQIIEKNKVTPDISKIQWYALANLQFSPIYGKVAVVGRSIINFDVFGTFGTGVVRTRDDLEALQQTTEQLALDTEKQFHPALSFGGGLRVIFGQFFALRVEARGLSYIEVVESYKLELKNNMLFLGGASFFFPGMKS